jgi:Histidine kinase-, DNA gyrase B-, and HSP90-like ATPase
LTSVAPKTDGSFALRYLPRVGLLPELTRQTYSSLAECLREAVLNSVDAGATRVELDFSRAAEGRLRVRDNGSGMSPEEAQHSFLAVGGSQRFGEADQHGRIGIGSLAMLQMGAVSTVTSKVAGSPSETVLTISHSWEMDRADRLRPLSDFEVGHGVVRRSSEPAAAQFTEIEINDLTSSSLEVLADPSRIFSLIERLRAVLPLPLGDSPVLEALADAAEPVARALIDHAARFSVEVQVATAWGTFGPLTRRLFGDEGAEAEPISAGPAPLDRAVRTSDGREIRVLGFMVAQGRASSEWSGLTGRHQNVAVEEHTFFDVTEDPGFRRYITGEVHVLGDVRREDLITIDRRSFSRGSRDFHEVRRVMQDAIREFKIKGVQRPRRARSEAVRRAKKWVSAVDALRQAGESAERVLGHSRPLSSGVRWTSVEEVTYEGMVRGDGSASEVLAPLEVASVADQVIPAGAREPLIDVGGISYRLRFVHADGGPISFRARPREIRVNVAHPLLRDWDPPALRLAMALEAAFLLGADGAAGTLYDDVLRIVAGG